MRKLVSLMLAVMMLATLFVPALADVSAVGAGAGKNGEDSIEVSVTFGDDGVIKAVEVTKNGDDAGISDPAVNTLPARIVEANSIEVDAVAGATLTSNGILAAVEAAIVAAGFDPAAYKAAAEAPEAEKAAETQDTEVLVVGAGIAGYTAAVAAREAGAQVTLIDKMAMVGGTTNVAGGILVCVGSELFKDSRLESDSLEAIMEYWRAHMSVSGVDSGYPEWDRLERVLADTGKTVDWLVANNIEFSATPYPGSATYPMALANGGGAGLIQMLAKQADAMGITLITECKATALITDESGAVVGAKAETADKDITFNAKSVVLATGGISQNEELVAKYSPKLHRAGLVPTSAVSHTGDGFLMALEVGAGTFDVFATPLFGTTFDPALADSTGLTIYAQLGVNANGLRFGNEAASAGWDVMDYTASDMIQDANAPFWYIFDSSDEAVNATLEAGAAQGVIAKGETIEDLAREMHV